MIDQERTFPLKSANRESDLDLHLSTWFRYAHRGLQDERLEIVKKGGATHTSREAIWRFFDALTERRSKVRRQRSTDVERQTRIARELEVRFGL